jgi:hypothetical protein
MAELIVPEHCCIAAIVLDAAGILVTRNLQDFQ